MRCLLVGDLHYALRQFDWVTERAGDFDLVILAGDHLEIASAVDRATQSLVVEKYFERLQQKTRLIVCSGNHDLDAEDKDGERFARWIFRSRHHGVLADGESLEIGDTLFTVCAWWDGPETKARVGQQLAQTALQRKDRWIWIYHAPPAGSPTSWAGRRAFGDPALTEWIAHFQPDFVVSGHVHEAPFVKDGAWADLLGSTWVFNPGREPGDRPAHIVLDTDVGEAFWVSSAGAELASLALPMERPVQPIYELPAWFTA